MRKHYLPTRIVAHDLAKLILHEMYDRVGHYPFQKGYSYKCNGKRIAVRAGKFGTDRNAWVWWIRKIYADEIMLVAFGQDFEVAHVWLVPADVVREDGRFLVREEDVHIWDEYAIDFKRFAIR